MKMAKLRPAFAAALSLLALAALAAEPKVRVTLIRWPYT